MSSNFNKSWREFVEGEYHLFLANELHMVFLSVLNYAYEKKIIFLDERDVRFVDSKNKNDLSDVTSLYCFSRFKEQATAKFIKVDMIALKLKRIGYLDDIRLSDCADKALALYPLVFSLKSIRNTNFHEMSEITDPHFLCWVAATIGRVVQIVDSQKKISIEMRDKCKDLMFSVLGVRGEIPVTRYSAPKNVAEEDDGLDENPLPLLSKDESAAALRELRSDIKMVFLDKRIVLNADQNILQKRIVSVIQKKMISSFDELSRNNVFEAIHNEYREEFDAQTALFSVQIDQILARTDYSS